MSAAELLVVDLFPSLLQPEGDHGNAVALAARARGYGAAARCVTVHPGQEVPAADVYLLGGSEDLDLVACAAALRDSGALTRAVAAGAAVLGVGAGFTVLGREFEDATGGRHPGAGLLDVEVTWNALADGPVITRPNENLGLPALSGYEFHRGRARRGPRAKPFAAVEVGVGDGPASAATDGAVEGQVIGTWLHGPLLPRNPAVADLLIRWVRPSLLDGSGLEGPPIDDALADAVRATRMAQARPSH